MNMARVLRWLWVLSLLACTSPSGSARSPAPAEGNVSAATAPDAGGPAGDALYEAARREGRVVAYFPNPPKFEAVKAAFERRYPGITVELVGMRASEYVPRINAEYASGQHVADVVGVGGSTMLELVRHGWLVAWEPPDADQLIGGAKQDGGLHWTYQINVWGALVNTSLVPADKIPTKKEDLLDPWWRGDGKMLVEDPRSPGGGSTFFATTYRLYGRPFLERFATQNPTYTRDYLSAPARVARGEFAMFVPQTVGEDAAKVAAVAPVRLVLFQDATDYAPISLGILSRAPHPNAARLWAGFLFSEEGQLAFVEKSLQYGARKGLPDPPGFPSLEGVVMVTRTREEYERNDEFVRIYNEVLFR
jgi:iron(III) transport system substrate-binding protein